MSTPVDEETMLRGLRALRVDPPGAEDFLADLHVRLASAGSAVATPAPARAARSFVRALLWPAAGVLCGVLSFLVLVAVRGGRVAEHGPGPVASGEVAPTYRVPSSKVAVIKLSFAATVDVADVDFEVELPEGLHFWSGGERLATRVFRWPGELRAGDNIIPVAVRGERPGLYRVKARAVAAGETVEHQVLLDVRGGA